MKIRFFIASHHLFFLILSATMLMLPAFIGGAGGFDLHFHSLASQEFSKQFWQGNLYPRWLMDNFAGRGSPMFFYYPPLGYYIASIFAFLPPGDFSFIPMAAATWLSLIISGIGFYAWMKEEGVKANAALMGSLIYMSAPNHIAQNFYGMFLYSSAFAYMMVPFGLLFAKRAAQAKPFSIPALAFSLSLLILSNIPMLVFCGPLIVGYGVIHLSRATWRKGIICLARAVFLGFGLASFYLLPCLLYRDFVIFDMHWVAFTKSDHFFLNLPSIQAKLETFYFVILALLLAYYYKSVLATKRDRYFLWASLAVFFLMLPVSALLWEHVFLLSIVQMAERFFIIPAIALALWAALAWPKRQWLTYAVITGYGIATLVIGAQTRMSEKDYQAEHPGQYESYNMKIDQYTVYLPTQNLITHYGTTKGKKEIAAHSAQIEIAKGNAQIEIVNWRPRFIQFRYRAKQASTIRLRQFDFPGWRAFKGAEELDILRDAETGEMLLSLPKGEGEVTVELTQLLPEKVGKFISFLAAMGVLLIILLGLQKKHRHPVDLGNQTM